MKKTYFLAFAILLLILPNLNAQETLANYPLTEDGIDQTGNNDDMLLKNPLFENGGVYSNGIYFGDDENGVVLWTPSIKNINLDKFTLDLEFLIEEYPENKMPVIVGGNLWRWMGVYIYTDKLSLMTNDFSQYEISEKTVELNKWHKLRFSFSQEAAVANVFLNGEYVTKIEIGEFDQNDDANFLNTHGGSGETFKGYWKNLKIKDDLYINNIPESEFSGLNIITANEYLTVNVPQNLEGVELSIIDLKGRLCSRLSLSSGTNTVGTGELSENIYLLVFKNNTGNTYSKKVMLK